MRKLLVFVLTLAMLFSVLPVLPAFAAGETSDYTEAPQNLRAPDVAADESSILVMWDKPDDYYESEKAIVDYEVFIDGELQMTTVGGQEVPYTASLNFADNYTYLNAYVETFYKTFDKNHHKISYLSFFANDLEAETDYEFEVRAVYADGTVSELSDAITASTKPVPVVINVLDYLSAEDNTLPLQQLTGVYRTAGADWSATDPGPATRSIEARTAAIQKAIDDCPPGGKVILPGSGDNANPLYYVSGSIFLKSDMTFEIQEGASLFGSPVFDHYPRSLLVYPYSQDIRTYGLINAVTWDYGNAIKNVRLVGKGIVDGNGWKPQNGGYNTNTNPASQGQQTLYSGDPGHANNLTATQNAFGNDPTGLGWNLPQFYAGSNSSVRTEANATLAKDAMDKSASDSTPNSATAQHYNTRPNLTVARGVDNLYYGGLIYLNPAFHGIVNYHSENIVVNGVVAMMFNTNNGDTIEFGDSYGLTLLNNFWDSGDDAINFASGQGTTVRNDSEKVASGGGKIFNNFVRTGHGALLATGSHTGGWLGEMLAEESIVNFSESGGSGVMRIKSGQVTGGGVRDLTMRDVAINYAVASSYIVRIETAYSDGNASTAFGPESERPLTYKNINIRNATVGSTASSGTINILAGSGNNQPTTGPTPVLSEFHFEDINVLTEGNNRIGTVNVSGAFENSTFKNINKAVNLTNSNSNIFVENCGPGRDVTSAPVIPTWAEGAQLTATNAANNTVNLSWPAAEGATHYTVFVDDGYDSEFGYSNLPKTVVTGTEATFDLAYGENYTITVRPENRDVAANHGRGALIGNSITINATGDAPSTTVTASNRAITQLGSAGITWHNFQWTPATCSSTLSTGGASGIQYYDITATPADSDFATKKFRIYIEKSTRNQYSLSNLEPGVQYTMTMCAVAWDGTKSQDFNSITFTTTPGTLMQIPEWDEGAEIEVLTEAKRVGDELTISWPANAVAEYSDGNTAKFAGFRILVNGMIVQPKESDPAFAMNKADAANATPTITANPEGTLTYTLDTSGWKEGQTYIVSVQAGNEILKYASGSGGLAGSTGFTGTKNTDLLRNNVTFGKWTNHGPSVSVTLTSGNVITLDYGEGEGDVSRLTLTAGQPYGELPAASRYGFIFDGWSVDGTTEGIVTAESIVGEDVTTLFAIWTADPKVYIKVSGSEILTLADEAEYIVSVGNVKDLATVTLWLEVDGAFLNGLDAEALIEGFGPIGGIQWTNTEGTTYVGRVTIGALEGEPLTSLEYVELFKLNFGLKAEGNTTVKIKDIKLSGYDETGKAAFFDSVIKNDTVETEIGYPYSIYDLNKDKAVDQLDLTIAQQHFASKLGDSDWDEVKIADVNGDNVVDIADLILILNNIIW